MLREVYLGCHWRSLEIYCYSELYYVYKLNFLLVTGPVPVAVVWGSYFCIRASQTKFGHGRNFLCVPCHTTNGRDYNFGQHITSHTLGRIDWNGTVSSKFKNYIYIPPSLVLTSHLRLKGTWLSLSVECVWGGMDIDWGNDLVTITVL